MTSLYVPTTPAMREMDAAYFDSDGRPTYAHGPHFGEGRALGEDLFEIADSLLRCPSRSLLREALLNRRLVVSATVPVGAPHEYVGLFAPDVGDTGELAGCCLVIRPVNWHGTSGSFLDGAITSKHVALYHYCIVPPLPTDIPLDDQARWVLRRAILVDCDEAYAVKWNLGSIDAALGRSYRDILGPDTGFWTAREWAKRGYRLEDVMLERNIAGHPPRTFVIETHCHVREERVSAAWGSQVEVTSLLRARHEADQRAYLVERLLMTMPGAVFLYDTRSQRDVLAHGQLFAMLGLPDTADSFKSTLCDLAHPEDAGLLGREMEHWQGIADGEVSTVSFRARHADGRYRHLRIHASAYSRDNQGVRLVYRTPGITRRTGTACYARRALVKHERGIDVAQPASAPVTEMSPPDG